MAHSFLAGRVVVSTGDITTLAVDAIRSSHISVSKQRARELEP